MKTNSCNSIKNAQLKYSRRVKKIGAPKSQFLAQTNNKEEL